ncbi:MAG: cation:proton antiporter [Vicinamibacterales bacterium]
MTTTLAIGAGLLFGWGPGGGLVLGLATSVASTIVMVKALEARDALEQPAGRIGVGWLVVEDMFSVLVLVLLPMLAPSLGGRQPDITAQADTVVSTLVRAGDSLVAYGFREAGMASSVPLALLIAAINVAGLAFLVLYAGRRLSSGMLQFVDRTRSDELFTLAGVVIALFIAATADMVFGLSVALGAFLAGVMMAGSPVSHKVTADVRPLRDLFGVIFFAAVGMMLDPEAVLASPVPVVVVTLLIVIGKPLIAAAILGVLGESRQTAAAIAPALGQIGEFSFILVVLGRQLELIPDAAYQVVIAASIISIAVNPFLFAIAGRFGGATPPESAQELAA